MPATIAPAVLGLQAETNARFLHRDKRSDGIRGDADHLARGSDSDHTPWLHDTYRAFDVDEDLEPGGDPGHCARLAEHLRRLGEAGDPRLRGGGYLIYEGRIAGDVGGWAWRRYPGKNPHRGHLHVSVTRDRAGYTTSAPWGVAPAPAPTPPPPPGRGAGLVVDGKLGLATVRALQRALHVTVDGDWGPATTRALQQLLKVRVDGDFGPASTRALQRRLGVRADGDVGPATIRALQQRLNAGAL